MYYKFSFDKTGTSFLLILSLIRLNLHMSRLTSGWNEFKKEPYFFQVISAPAEDIFRRKKKEILTENTSLLHKEKST